MRTAHSLLRLVSILLDLAQDALQFLLLGTRSSAALKAENIFLRKQLALYLEREAKPRRATGATRLSMVLLSRLFAWQNALINVKPETFLGWHRKGFQLLWRWKSRPRGRPRLREEVQKLIQRMARENPTWGEERIAAELLLKLRIRVSPRTVRRECLDFLIPLNEGHLRSLLKEWVTHYNRGRPHASLGPGIPGLRPASSRPDSADTAFRLVTKLWPKRSWVDSITNTVWKNVRLDPEEKCS